MGRRLLLSTPLGFSMALQNFQSLLQLAHGFQQLGELGKTSYGAQPVSGRKRRGPGHPSTGCDIAANSALRVDLGPLMYREVSRRSDLSGHYHSALEYCAPR